MQPKATSRYIITNYRGMEFIDLIEGNHSRNNWTRGTCQFGILPCNGLIYAPPHACGCYPGVKLQGFWAFAPEAAKDTEPAGDEALQRGPAYGWAGSAKPPDPAQDWPAYRHDALRSGWTVCEAPEKPVTRWNTVFGGRLSAPVAAGGIALAALVDEHRVVAVEMEHGKLCWSFTADGRVDSPPAIHGGTALFGSADGYVYCLRLTDGALIWRYRVAPRDRRTIAFESLESVWPVHGSVLILDNAVYAAAGRSTYLDGGINLVALDPKTGVLRHQGLAVSAHPKGPEGIDGPVPAKAVGQNEYDGKTFNAPDLSDAFFMKGGTVADVLVSDGSSVFLKMWRFDKACVRQKLDARHLYSTAGLLDAQDHHSAHWLLGNADMRGLEMAYNRLTGGALAPCGKMVVFDDKAVFVLNATFSRTSPDTGIPADSLRASVHRPFTGQDDQRSDIPPKAKLFGEKQPKSAMTQKWGWNARLKVKARAMARAGATLLVAGESVRGAADEPPDREKRLTGLIQVFQADSGVSRGDLTLSAPPVWDGMAVAAGRVLVAKTDGALECLAAGPEGPGKTDESKGKGKP